MRGFFPFDYAQGQNDEHCRVTASGEWLDTYRARRTSTVLTRSAVRAFVKHPENQDGFVVEVRGAGLKAGDGVDDGLGGGGGGGVFEGFENLGESLVAEHLALGVLGVEDAVGEEDDEVAGAGGEGELFVLGVGEEAEWEAFGLDGYLDGDGCAAAGFCVAGGRLREARLWRAPVGPRRGLRRRRAAGRSRRWRSGGSGWSRPRRR